MRRTRGTEVVCLHDAICPAQSAAPDPRHRVAACAEMARGTRCPLATRTKLPSRGLSGCPYCYRIDRAMASGIKERRARLSRRSTHPAVQRTHPPRNARRRARTQFLSLSGLADRSTTHATLPVSKASARGARRNSSSSPRYSTRSPGLLQGGYAQPGIDQLGKVRVGVAPHA